jgi:hypothetical protein
LRLLRRDLQPELRLRKTPGQQRRLTISAFLLRVVVPVALLLLGTSAVNCAIAATSILVADFIVRFVVVSIPHTEPRTELSRA